MFDALSKNAAMLGLWSVLGFLVVRFFLGKLEKIKADQQAPDAAAQFDGRAKQAPSQKPPSSGGQWFEVLQVNSTANLDEIKAAYKKKISQYHPDKVAKLGLEFQEIAERKSKEINAAYEFITRRYGRD